MFREILDRLDGPVVRNLRVESDATLTINVVPFECMASGMVSEAEIRRKVLQETALEAHVVDSETSEDPAGDDSPDEGAL
jgi:hypothetical protein